MLITCCSNLNNLVTILDEALAANPFSTWWIKRDGCDIMKELNESVSGRWNGDIDLNNGKLELQFEECQRRIKFVGLPPHYKKEQIYQDLRHM